MTHLSRPQAEEMLTILSSYFKVNGEYKAVFKWYAQTYCKTEVDV